MWESAESLVHLRNWIQISVVVFAILAALSGFIGHIVGNRITKLNSEESARLKAELETTSNGTKNLIKKLEPRSITDEQRLRMVEILKTVSGGPVLFQYMGEDSEAFSFAETLNNVVADASWPSGKIQSAFSVDKPVQGIVLFVRSIESPPQHALPLQQALKEAGIFANAGSSSKVDADTVKVVIGAKP